MQNKTKFIHLAVILVLGIVGGIVRGTELIYAINVYTGIYEFGGLSFLLPMISIVAVLFSAVTMYKYKEDREKEYIDIMKINNSFLAVVNYIGAVVLMISGVISLASALTDPILRSVFSGLAAGAIGVKGAFTSSAFSSALTDSLFAVLTSFSGASIFFITGKRKNGELKGNSEILLNVPLYWACFLFIFTFIEHPVEPVMQIFAYDLLASCALVLAVYKFAAIAYGRKSLYIAMCSSLCALYFMMTVAIGRVIHIIVMHDMYYLMDSPFRMVCYGGMFLILLSDVVCVMLNSGKKQNIDSEISK